MHSRLPLQSRSTPPLNLPFLVLVCPHCRRPALRAPASPDLLRSIHCTEPSPSRVTSSFVSFISFFVCPPRSSGFFFFFYLLPCVSLLVFVARRSVSASPTRQAVRPISRATALRNGAVACWCSPTTSDQIRHFRLPLLDTLQRPPPTEEKQKPVGLDTYIPLVRIDASCAAPPHTLFVLSSTSKHPLHPCVAPSTHPAPPHRAFSPSLLFFGASRVEPSA